METKKGLKEFEEALSKDEALRNEYEAECKRIAEAKEAANDAEVMVKAAGKLGFELSIAELERKTAAKEALSDDDLENISGGLCEDNDEYGNDLICFASWHCFSVVMHTDSEDKRAACFKDYKCLYFNK